jgi:Phage integrase, N-terminal SAM-like domain
MNDHLTVTTLVTTTAASVDEAQLAAAAFLARYSGRTLDAYRHDLRSYFQWALDAGLEVLVATRPHVELYWSAMEQRGLAASTIDRRLSTVCGFYRFATSTVASARTLPSTCDVRRCHGPMATAWTAASSEPSCSPQSASTETTQRSPYSWVLTACAFPRPAPPTSRTLE